MKKPEKNPKVKRAALIERIELLEADAAHLANLVGKAHQRLAQFEPMLANAVIKVEAMAALVKALDHSRPPNAERPTGRSWKRPLGKRFKPPRIVMGGRAK